MAPEKSESDLLAEISAKLDRLIGLSMIAGKDQDQQIALLRNLKLDWKTIGELVGLKPDAARMRLRKPNSS